MFIKITPEGYTTDGKYRLVPVDIKSEIHSVYRHAMGQGLREQDKRGVLAFHKSVIETAPPPPAEMLVDERMDAMETELAFLEDWLNYTADPVGIEYDNEGNPQPVYRSTLDVTEAMSSRHRELSEKLTAATASTGESNGNQ